MKNNLFVSQQYEDKLIHWIKQQIRNKEFVTEQVEANFLGIVQKQFTEISEMQKAMSKLMTNYTELLANEKYINHALSEIYRKLNQLEKIEELTSKGGRKRNLELYEVVHSECNSWFSKKGKKPSATKLTSLVEIAMTSKKGEGREDGNKYLSIKSASNFLRQWQPPGFEFNRQDLVKAFAN